METKQQIGRRYRLMTLELLTRLGYATTRQVATGVFSDTEVSSRKMAGRTIRRLKRDGLIVNKRVGGSVAGEMMIALNRAGVRAIAAEIDLPDGRPHARDWIRHAHPHRTACNSVYVAHCRGLTLDVGWTELEIRYGLAPDGLNCFKFQAGSEIHQKIPDLILDDGGKKRWVEVENSWRSSKDLIKLISFLRAIFGAPKPLVEKVQFFVTVPSARSIGKRLRKALTPDPRGGFPPMTWELDERILKDHIDVFEFDLETIRFHRIKF